MLLAKNYLIIVKMLFDALDVNQVQMRSLLDVQQIQVHFQIILCF